MIQQLLEGGRKVTLFFFIISGPRFYLQNFNNGISAVLAATNVQNKNQETVEVIQEPDFASPINNVTVALGREAKLSCVVDNLGRFKVGWMKADTQTILSVQHKVITHNARVSVSHEEPRTWNLHMRQIQEDDRGCYMCQINTPSMKKTVGCIDVHVPPDILDSESSNDVKVSEGGDVSLRCIAKGYPTPEILWKREDGEKIIIRTGKKEKIKVSEVDGPVLNLTRVNKRHMGAYQCIANNGVPPAVVKRIEVDVHFAPSISVPNQLVAAPLGSSMELKCLVEASPRPITYWRKENLKDILMSSKYKATEEVNSYKTTMTLLVQNLTIDDFGLYLCTARNSISDVENQIRTYKIDMPATRTTSHQSRGRGVVKDNSKSVPHTGDSSSLSEGGRKTSGDHSLSSDFKTKKDSDFISSPDGFYKSEDRQGDRSYLPMSPSLDMDRSAGILAVESNLLINLTALLISVWLRVYVYFSF